MLKNTDYKVKDLIGDKSITIHLKHRSDAVSIIIKLNMWILIHQQVAPNSFVVREKQSQAPIIDKTYKVLDNPEHREILI
ncbi:hypothetical protein Hneap_1872 [Halothiobacillus neapolitanus c2]|uniref:Uncharacterized protein n=1 Tax=Halothiobacillus neapolitanus (strain ATCC 23641 / DSM 15147 / CIP 104769 / NCIMB 8539 / c2) TaxID=555778 RepID=D0L1X1_HALNC|nr:hypothetical protein Hneap_1872 [Halothiobacillus neapolitanus c2]TDN65196.1 hypothetical protein C8D83_102268 [Halothiobacillus neapolitanus]